MVYFYSYVYRVASGWKYESEVSKRHPLLIVKDWHDSYNGNDGATLISYHAIGDEQLGDIELQKYIDYSLSNYGELGGSATTPTKEQP